MADLDLFDFLPLAPAALFAALFARAMTRRSSDDDAPRGHYERALAARMRESREKT